MEAICKVYARYMKGICKIYVGYMLDICWVYVRYMLDICWIYVGYMLDIARLGDGEVMVKLKRTLKIRNPQLRECKQNCAKVKSPLFCEFYGRINVLFVIKVFVYICYDVYFCNVD